MAKLYSGKALTVFEVEELREALETIAIGLDQDSLHCRAAVDGAKEEEELKKRACPETQLWEFPMPGSMDEINQAANSQYQMSFQNVMSQAEIGFVPDSQVQSNLNGYDSVLEIPCPKPRKGSKGKKGVSKSKEEDWVICSAFLNVSKDPVTAYFFDPLSKILVTNQSSGGYYQRMHDYFHENLGTQSNRSVIAIQHRWLSIQKAVNKFSSFFSTVERLNESCHNEQSRTFGHCWDVLRHEPKWNDEMLEINTVGNATRVNQRLGANSADDQVLGGNADNKARPEGRDTAKKRKARPCEDTFASSAAIEVLSDMNARGQLKDDKEDTHMA
ncbi:hypothetical protein U9M48_019845 [Paspalum notatum var. saurae]|uniref:No apical meristem-associated C-terminal domain-containing protein n=1 Tax=Paspalum notatum var. saurae TaxID=547442 RepID=A0AAQ3WR28_PASNO